MSARAQDFRGELYEPRAGSGLRWRQAEVRTAGHALLLRLGDEFAQLDERQKR